VIFKIALPSASPDILAGMRLSLTVALILSVVCEILAGLDGLGHWVLLSARAFRSADLFAGVILLGLTGYVTSVRCRLRSIGYWRGKRRNGDRRQPGSCGYVSATGRAETSGFFGAVTRRRHPRPIERHNARRLKVTSTSWCRIPLPPLTSPRSRMMQYVPLLMRANFASRK
jgi:hypothetical protein